MTNFTEAVDRTRKWFFLEALVPAALVCSLYWPLGTLVKAIPYPFEQVFAGSDLLTLCGLLLFGLWIDIESLRDKGLPHRFWMENIRYVALTAAILFLVFYGFLKLSFLTYTVPTTGTPIDREITSIARFTVTATLFTVTFSLVARLFAIFAFHRKEKMTP